MIQELPSGTQSKVYRIGELADRTATTTRTLRYYEELGLLQPIRNTSGQRLYGDNTIQRLHFIHELKSGGFSLLEIKSFFESWNNNQTGAEASEATIGLIQQKMSEISELQKKLGKLNDELRAMITFLISCKNCDDKPSAENCGTCDKHPMDGLNPLLKNILQMEPKSS